MAADGQTLLAGHRRFPTRSAAWPSRGLTAASEVQPPFLGARRGDMCSSWIQPVAAGAMSLRRLSFSPPAI